MNLTTTTNIFGDFNGDWTVNMTDLIIGLQICAGIDPNIPGDANFDGSDPNIPGDTNQDIKLDMKDVIYILQILTDIR